MDINIVTEIADDNYACMDMRKIDMSCCSTEHIKVLRAYFCDDLSSPMFGRLIVIFQYKDERVFRIEYVIYNKLNGHKNQLMNIVEVLLEEAKSNKWLFCKQTVFGLKALIPGLCDSALYDKEAIALREFISKIKEYCDINNLMSMLLDKRAVY